MKRAKVAIVVALAVALGAAACSSPSKNSGNNSGGNTGDNLGKQVTATDPNAHGPAPAIPGAKSGGTITVTSQSTVSTMDPSDIYYTDSGEIARLIYRTPTQLAIVQGKSVLVPDLTDLGTESADGLSWTFKIQPGIKYQDGTPVQSADFAYAIERALDKKLYDSGPQYDLQYFVDGTTYKGPYDGSTCACVTTTADTFTIHLTKKFPDLPFYLTFPGFAPIPQAKDTKANYQLNPMTTGPYMYDGPYQPGVELKLKKNPYWQANTDAVRHQYPDGFDFKWGGDDLKYQTSILQGTDPVDTTSINYGNLLASLIPKIQGPNADQLVTGPQPCTIVLNLDTRKIPDLNVRKAIALAVAFDNLEKAGGGNSYVQIPATTILPPSVPGYVKYPAIDGMTGVGNGNPAAAKQLLQQAGKLGFQLSWYYDNTTPTTQHAEEALANGFTAAGFTVKPIGVTPAQIRTKTADYTAPVNIGQSPAGWCSDWPSATTWFPQLFMSTGVANDLSWGMGGSAALDAQINAIAALPADQAEKKWGPLDQQILGTVPVVPLYYSKAANVYGTQLGGVAIDPSFGLPAFFNMYVK